MSVANLAISVGITKYTTIIPCAFSQVTMKKHPYFPYLNQLKQLNKVYIYIYIYIINDGGRNVTVYLQKSLNMKSS